jgi:hypothetical protein
MPIASPAIVGRAPLPRADTVDHRGEVPRDLCGAHARHTDSVPDVSDKSDHVCPTGRIASQRRFCSEVLLDLGAVGRECPGVGPTLGVGGGVVDQAEGVEAVQ